MFVFGVCHWWRPRQFLQKMYCITYMFYFFFWSVDYWGSASFSGAIFTGVVWGVIQCLTYYSSFWIVANEFCYFTVARMEVCNNFFQKTPVTNRMSVDRTDNRQGIYRPTFCERSCVDIQGNRRRLRLGYPIQTDLDCVAVFIGTGIAVDFDDIFNLEWEWKLLFYLKYFGIKIISLLIT